jgi:hypothetical protein
MPPSEIGDQYFSFPQKLSSVMCVFLYEERLGGIAQAEVSVQLSCAINSNSGCLTRMD